MLFWCCYYLDNNSISFNYAIRFLGNLIQLKKWSGRNKKKLRCEDSAEHPISALESFSSWSKVVDQGIQKGLLGGEKGKAQQMDSSDDDEDDDDVNNDDEEDDSDDDDESGEEEEEDDEEEDDENEDDDASGGTSRADSKNSSSVQRYQPDKVVQGEVRPTKVDYSFMGSSVSERGTDGVAVRQPSIVRDLWAQVR